MRSLTFKLIVAFLLTSVLGVGLAAVIARGVTAREFSRFVMGQLRNEFVANAASYYQAHGSWAGAGEYFRQLDAAPPEPGAPPRPPQFVLADQNGVARHPGAALSRRRSHPGRQAGAWGAGRRGRPQGRHRDRRGPSARAEPTRAPISGQHKSGVGAGCPGRGHDRAALRRGVGPQPDPATARSDPGDPGHDGR